MKAVEVTLPKQLMVADLPTPEGPGAAEVLIKVKAAGVCGSDVAIYHGKNAFATYPRIIGHEFAGEVVALGSEVGHLEVGDKVAVDPVVACGSCYACNLGRHNVCKSVNVLGVHRDGGFREYIVVMANQAHKLPVELPWEQAAMVEPFSIAAQSISQGRLTASDTVMICGAGPIGLAILQAVKMVGAKVAIMDIVDSRLTRAKKMGADLVINTAKSDLVQEMLAFTQGNGASVIFEATGNVKVLEQCIRDIVAIAGRIVVLGISSEAAQIAPIEFMRREMEIIGTRLSRNKFPEVIEWFRSGSVNPAGLVSHIFEVNDAQKAFELIDNQSEDVCKVVLKF